MTRCESQGNQAILEAVDALVACALRWLVSLLRRLPLPKVVSMRHESVATQVGRKAGFLFGCVEVVVRLMCEA